MSKTITDLREVKKAEDILVLEVNTIAKKYAWQEVSATKAMTGVLKAVRECRGSIEKIGHLTAGGTLGNEDVVAKK